MHHHHLSAAHTATMQGLGENVVYLMGLSFVLGSLFTVFILVVLDYMRQRNANKS